MDVKTNSELNLCLPECVWLGNAANGSDTHARVGPAHPRQFLTVNWDVLRVDENVVNATALCCVDEMGRCGRHQCAKGVISFKLLFQIHFVIKYQYYELN